MNNLKAAYHITVENCQIKVTNLSDLNDVRFFDCIKSTAPLSLSKAGITTVIPFELIQLPLFDNVTDLTNSINDDLAKCGEAGVLPEIIKASYVPLTVCEVGSGNYVNIIQCWEDGNLTGTFNAANGLPYTNTHIPIQDVPEYIETCEYRDDTDINVPEKIRPKVRIRTYQNKLGVELYVFEGDNVLDANNHIPNLENYTKMNLAGLPQFLPVEEVVEKTFEWCPAGGLPTGTYADVLAAAIAAGAGTLPNGNAPDGIIELEVVQEYKGQICNGQQTTAVGTSIGGNVTLDGGQKFCETVRYRDADCDGKADACYDLTTPFIVPDGAGLIVKVKLVECDPDSTDPTV